MNKPIGVAAQLTALTRSLPDALAGSLPTIAEREAEAEAFPEDAPAAAQGQRQDC